MDKVIMLITHLYGIKDTVERPKLMRIDQKLGFAFKQGRIHGISRSPSSFLPAENKALRTDRRTDGRTHAFIESVRRV